MTVDRSGGPARAAGAAGGTAAPPLKLSIRLERQALTDPEAAMLADWCCRQRGAVDVLKLWLFDNRLTDAGAEAVARILAAHPGMQEVGRAWASGPCIAKLALVGLPALGSKHLPAINALSPPARRVAKGGPLAGGPLVSACAATHPFCLDCRYTCRTTC